MNELAELAKLDGLIGGKKEEVNLESAMSKNEKIRDWVSLPFICTVHQFDRGFPLSLKWHIN